MAFDPPVYRSGDFPRAAEFNARNAEIRRLGGGQGSAGMVVHQGAGNQQFGRPETPCIYARLTGPAEGDGGYPWVEVWPALLGTWIEGDRVGTAENGDLAYEIDGRADLDAGTTVYELCRGVTSGEWLFDADCCESPGIPGCPCPSTPATLRVLDPVYGPADLIHDPALTDGGVLQWRSACRALTTSGTGLCAYQSYTTEEVTTRLAYALACTGSLYYLSARYWGCYPGGGEPAGVYGNPEFYQSFRPMARACTDTPLPFEAQDSLGCFDPLISPAEQESCGAEIAPLVSGGVPTYAAGYPHDVPENFHTCTPFCAQFVADDATGPIGPGFPAYGGFYGGADNLGFVVYDPATPYAPAVSPRVLVRTPLCAGDPPTGGDPIAGATVEIRAVGGDGTVLDSGTSDVDGLYEPELTDWGVYEATATKDGCVGKAKFVVGPCGDDGPFPVELCCAHVCLTVTALDADDPPEAIPHPLEGATVTISGIGSATTDAEGVACADLTTDQMLALPVSGDGSDCSARDLTVTVTKAGYLSRCFTTQVYCGDTEATGAITLYGLRTAGDDDRYIELPAALAAVCGDLGCETGGWIGRGVIPIRQAIQFDYIEYEFSLDEGGTDWYSLRPASMAGVLTLDLDLDLLDGDVLPPWHSPFGNVQRVEWHGQGAGIWTSRGEGIRSTAAWEVWMKSGAVRVRLEFAGYDPEDPDALGMATVPTQVPEGSEIGTVQAVDIVLPVAVDPCDFVGSEQVVTGTLSDGKGFRALVRWTEAAAP